MTESRSGADIDEKKRLEVFRKARQRTTLPYDYKRVREVSDRFEGNLQELRINILRVMSETYSPQIDKENARAVSRYCEEKGVRLLVARFGRAFYTDALLIAGSKALKRDSVTKGIERLKRDFYSIKLRIKTAELKEELIKFEALGADITGLLNVSGSSDIPEASIQGAIRKMRHSLRGFENNFLMQADKVKTGKYAEVFRSGKAALGKVSLSIEQDMKDVRNKLEKLFSDIDKIELAVLGSPKHDPAFVTFISRLHELDAINIARVNEMLDPFFGENKELEELIHRSGHNVYISPSPGPWLQVAHDWVEALPAYAKYTIIPENGDAYRVEAFTERKILELIYKVSADDWALNIEDVMAGEHLALAGEIIRRTSCRAHLLPALAAVVERTYENLCGDVCVLVGKGLSRFNAVKEVIEANHPKNLVRSLLKGNSEKKLAGIVKKQDLEQRVEFYSGIAGKKKRAIPNAHVLTTLGPTETETNIARWLEEAMLVSNIIRKAGLAHKVQAKLSGWRDFIISIAEAVIAEQEMEGELETDKGKGQAILSLVGLYPELSREITKVGLLLESEGVKRPEKGKPVRIKKVENYIKTHPEIKEEAQKKCAFNNGLTRKITAADSRYNAELNSIIRMKVRDILVKSKGIYVSRDYLEGRVGALSVFNARKEVIAEENLSGEYKNPLHRFESKGPYKKYNLLYTPSRVDLGTEMVGSVRDVPKWVGGAGMEAAASGKSLYALFNYAGVTAVDSPGLAEFLKVGENFFTRGGVYYLSLTAGANINALGLGDFEFFQREWNRRGDRMVLPAGETYGGFCVPKEFSLLFAVITKGLAEGKKDYLLLNWKNRKALGAEEINRAGVFDKVLLTYKLIDEARKRNPGIAGSGELVGVMSAGYKEDVTDVRFSAGARKLEIYSGTALSHLLEDLDPEGRRLYGEEFADFISPADIRLVGNCAAKDLFGHVPMDFSKYAGRARQRLQSAGFGEIEIEENIRDYGVDFSSWKSALSKKKIEVLAKELKDDLLFLVYGNNLAQIAEGVRRRLAGAGFSEEMLRANAASFGADLRRWSLISRMSPRKRALLIRSIGDVRHILALEARDVFLKERYEEAVSGVDFIDLGIPDAELLDLIDNLPKLLYLMKKDRPASALVFVDGTSGARRRSFSMRYPETKRKVRELLALEEKAAYGAMGLGQATVEKWRAEMEEERDNARRLCAALVEGRQSDADEAYSKIASYIRKNQKADESLNEELRARELGLWKRYYHHQADTMGAVARGMPLSNLDFGKWLIVGGLYVLNGRFTRGELDELRSDYEFAIRRQKGDKGGQYSRGEIDEIFEFSVRQRYAPPEELFKEVSTGVAGSLKATEELAVQLESRDMRRLEAERSRRLSRRKDGFLSAKRAVKVDDFIEIHSRAFSFIGNGESDISQGHLGQFIYLTRAYFLKLLGELPDSGFKSEFISDVDMVFRGGTLLDSEYNALSHKIGRLFEEFAGEMKMTERAAQAAEMLDIILAIEKTCEVNSERDAWVGLATFLDMTLNNHIFDYCPYHYHPERTSAFKDWGREDVFKLSYNHHRWLYRYLRKVMVTAAGLGRLGRHYENRWLGELDKDDFVEKTGIGINVDGQAQRFWFSYARLRDTAVLIHDGYPLPVIMEDIDPELIGAGSMANIAIIYPYGNTTVTVALEQGVRLRADGLNLMITPFPRLHLEPGRERVTLHDGLMFISKADFKEMQGKGAKVYPETPPVSELPAEKGILCTMSFAKPIVANALWFHFTHFLRPTIEGARTPVVQPLLWEAATYLKGELPQMLEGSGVASPSQIVWRMSDSEGVSRRSALSAINKELLKLSKAHPVLIVKAEKESGGRRSLILPVRDEKGHIKENIERLTALIYEISMTDNVVVQEVIPSRVRQLYTDEFLASVRERFINELGIGITASTPLFSYFRLIVSKNIKGGWDITHRITVVSTAGVANVGLGGKLFEYQDKKINPLYREDLRIELQQAALNALPSQRRFLQKNRKRILDIYLEAHPEFVPYKKEILKKVTDLTGQTDDEIPYEMADFMPQFLIDEEGNLTKIYDRDKMAFIPLYDSDGKALDVDIYDERGKKLPRVDAGGGALKINLHGRKLYYKKDRIRSLVIVKIEPNPGAGLWRPHNDRLKLYGRDGESVYKLFKNLGGFAKRHREKLP